MELEVVPIGSVHPLEGNPRSHSPEQVDALAESYRMFGQYRPLVVDEDDVILAGNGLHAAMVKAGAATVAVQRMTGLTADERTKLVLVDNRLGDMGTDDHAIVEGMLASLGDVDVPGFDDDVLQSLRADLDAVDTPDVAAPTFSHADPAPRVNVPVIDAVAETDPGDTHVDPTPVLDTGNAAGDALADAVEARRGRLCPTCGRAWT